MFSNLLKIRVHRNAKEPVNKKWNLKENMINSISNFNIGIPTGKINNLICLDIDNKDNGIEEFNKYILEFGEPQTVKQSTPNGGFHYIFKYSSSFITINYLKNKTKYRNCGIDIRSEGGYFVSAPSKIHDKEYKYIRDFDNYEVLEMPESLINWLLVNEDQNIKESRVYKSNYNYNITDEIIVELLDKLPENYLNNYSDWLKITTILKNLNKFDIWDSWSRRSNKYDYNKNIKTWNANNGIFDINYLIYIINTETSTNYNFIEKYKIYEPLTIDINCDKKTMNNRFLKFDYDIYKKYDTVILKSCTGTGKTTSVANNTTKYINDKGYKVLSIISRISLANQHIKDFNNLVSYQNLKKDIYNDNIVCCINSLLIYSDFQDYQFKDYIVYIDEVASFLECLTHNKTLDQNLRKIFNILMRIIINAHKVIVSDALINDNVFTLLSCRDDNKKVYIENTYKKYNGINAIKLNNELTFLNKIKNHCKKNNYFFFGCDSCSVVTDFYNECIKNAEDISKYVLITSNTKLTFDNVSEELKDKFVFYSPSITFGVDFSIDEAQNVFIYIKGDSILPSGSYQQTTRTRNMKNLYYYCNVEEKNEQFDTLEDVKTYYKNVSNASEKLNLMSLSIYDNCINDDLFFKIFTYNEYVKDIYNTNKKAHYENILLENKFVIKEEGKQLQIDEKYKKEMAYQTKIIEKRLFDNFLIDNRKLKKYTNINNNIEALNLTNQNNEILIKYSDIILNSNNLTDHFNIIRLLKSDEYIKNKVKAEEEASFNLKCYNSIYHKIFILRTIELDNNIKPLNVEHFNKVSNKEVILSNDLYKNICYVFRSSKSKPTNQQELGVLYRGMIKNICDSDIFKIKRNNNIRLYSLNIDYIKNHIILNSFSNPSYTNYHEYFKNLFEIQDKFIDSQKRSFLD